MAALPEISIKRPVFSIVVNLILIIIGCLGFYYLDTAFFPKFEANQIQVVTQYPGASAALVESSITTPLEQGIAGVSKIDTVTSKSYASVSVITLSLTSGANVNQVANDLRDKIEQARRTLPPSIDPPRVHVGLGESNFLDFGFSSAIKTPNEIQDYLRQYVLPPVEQLPGVADAELDGGDSYVIRMRLDAKKMATLGISVDEVATAVNNSNLELPAGEIKGQLLNYPITAKTKLSKPEEFAAITVKNKDGHLIHIRDIAHVALESEGPFESKVTVNGKPGVILDVNNATDANPLKVANRVRQFIQEIRPQLPADIQVTPVFDMSSYMKDSIKEVYVTIGIAILCVAIIMFLFLGQWRMAFIPIATIPVCVIATFGVMYFFGFTINMITLLALVLSIGLVVDDAIVMLENIHRHIEQGEKPWVAAIKGSKEIMFPVIAMTITLAAVYAPVGLVRNEAAIIFQSFAWTLAGAILISGFVALTLSPMMSARLLQGRTHQSAYTHFLDRFYLRLSHGYKKILSTILQRHLWFSLGTILLIIGGVFLTKHVSMAFVPPEDMSFIIVQLNASGGSSAAALNASLSEAGKIIRRDPEIESSTELMDTNPRSTNMILVHLLPYEKRKHSAQQIADHLNESFSKVPGLEASALTPSFNSGNNSPIEFAITNPGSYQDVRQIADNLVKQLQKDPALINPRSNLRFDSLQYDFTVNRVLADQLKISVKDIDNTISALSGGQKISDFTRDGQIYGVYLQSQAKDLQHLSDIGQFYIKNADQQLIPISNLITMTPTLSQHMLPHYDRLRSATISAELGPGYDLGTAIAHLQKNLPQLLPSQTHYNFVGTSYQALHSNSSMGLIFLLAFIFIYLVLAAQFESFLDPLIILLVVPLSVFGAILTLKLAGGSLNIYTDIGLITLIGLIAKHGILITQFANELQKKGKPLQEALVEAASIRLRPILMTTAAMIIGAVPLILTGGGSAASRHQIGWVLIGGLFFGTFFSLILVPIAYNYANKLRNRIMPRRKIHKSVTPL